MGVRVCQFIFTCCMEAEKLLSVGEKNPRKKMASGYGQEVLRILINFGHWVSVLWVFA